jgi:hypothetical protein
VKRILIASVMAMTVGAALLAAGSTAGAAGPGPVITFDDANNVVTLQIPDPPCPTTEPGCVWKFFLNEPKVSVDVSTVYSTQGGTLTLAYPQNFCGIIQADAYIGPSANGPWTPQRGWQHQLPDSDCTPTPPTPPSGPVQPVIPPDGPQTTPVVTTPPVTVPATTQAASVPVATTTPSAPVTPVVKAAAEPTSLPFTGVNLMPFVLSGVTCVALGLGLLFGRRKRSL